MANMSKSSASHRKFAIKAFQWVIHSKVPMDIEELVDVLATDVAAEPPFSPKRPLDDREDIFRICSYLIDVSPRNRRGEKHEHNPVRFAHLSVQEYLLSDQLLASPIVEFAPTFLDAHALIARDCLSYLLHANKKYGMEARNVVTMNGLDQYNFTMSEFINQYEGWKTCGWPEQIDEYEKELKAALPLIFYAAESWAHHARIAEEQDSELFQLMIEAFAPGIFEKWTSFVDLRWISYRKRRNLFGRGRVDRLTYAIGMQLPKMVQHVLRQGDDVNTDGSESLTPMQVAARVGNLDIMEVLIQFGANVEVYSGDNHAASPLIFAAQSNFVEVMKFLLDKGVDIDNRPEEILDTPLMAAAKMNHLETARFLTSKCANVNVIGMKGQSALIFVSSRGYTVMVPLLLSNGISRTLDSNIVALRAAATKGRTEIMRILLEAGVDVNAIVTAVQLKDLQKRNDWAQNALQAAVEHEQLSVAKLLVDWGADVNVQANGERRTALHLLAYTATKKVRQAFSTVMHTPIASWRGHSEMVQLLIESRANVNIRGGKYETALQAACAGSAAGIFTRWSNDPHFIDRTSTTDPMLQYMENIYQLSGRAGDPHHLAVQFERITVLQTLLENGADPNIRGGQWGSALQATLELGFGHAAHLLLRWGADRDVKPELESRLDDVDRGINVLFWRDHSTQVRNEDGEWVSVSFREVPDGRFRLPDSWYFDKSMLNSPPSTASA
ncbi:MAG: hypothetical protein Q9192_007464 [Flavoplaca navasiana]